ncbi:universal stress protein [Arthrobacter celericrescens]|uniref:universal stress protein n=1 Tax=Arthrobacter celericrescens TaxID=2320851 RepID=UPI000EA05739|nr:universal stress protein [Arthrobacter celericrescens]
MSHIVVGFDGSTAAAAAVRWAARQAALRNTGLTVVHCSMWPAFTHDLGPVPGIADSGLRHAAEAVAAEGAAVARDESPGVAVSTVVKYGWSAGLLREASDGAALLVVGSRGIGGFMGLLIGSVSLELAATADCPVAVIRQEARTAGPVVVGVDAGHAGTAQADAWQWEDAVRQAGILATLTEAPLRIVSVQSRHSGRHGPAAAGPQRPEEVLDDVERTARRWFPALEVRSQMLTGNSAAGTLLEASRDAAAIVVGTHGRGVVKGSIGSTAHAVLHHASCPVLVVRPVTAQASPG